MAKCERREIRPEPPPVEFVLTLSAREAQHVLFRMLGPAPSSDIGRAIADALRDMGVRL